MIKKILLLSIFVLSLGLSGCGLYDEIKAMSVYSDFLFSFNDYWADNYDTIPLTPAGEGQLPNSLIYNINITEESPIIGSLKNEYFGTVQLIYFAVADDEGVNKSYFEFNCELQVNSAATTIIGIVTDLKIQATCLDVGMVLDGYAFTQNDSTETVAIYSQFANLEGLWILLDTPTAVDAIEAVGDLVDDLVESLVPEVE